MIGLFDIKTTLGDLLGKKYGYKIHGMEVTEGYDRPSFFIDVRQTNASDVNANYSEKSFYITITYFQKELDEADNLEKVQEIEQLLRPNNVKNGRRLMRLNVGERYLPVFDYANDYVGTDRNILQIEFEIKFQECREHKENNVRMGEILIEQKFEK